MVLTLFLLSGTDYSSFRTQLWLFKNSSLRDSVYTYTLQNGDVAYFSVKPSVQTRTFEIYDNWRPGYAVILLMEASTGRILGLQAYSRSEPTSQWNKNLVLRNTFPAASLFKMATALAAMRKKGLSPDDSLTYRGKPHSRSPRVWLKSKYVAKATFAEAFGASCNPAFGVLAKEVGREALLEAARDLGFRVDGARFSLPEELGFGEAEKPRNTDSLMLMGAGFVNSTISPMHALLICSGVANGGAVMRPSLIDSVKSKNGELVWRARPETLWVAMSPGEASEMRELMLATVSSGTSYRAFYASDGSAVLGSVKVGGKTGTLTGQDPYGRCDWFAGFADDGIQAVAVSSLVVNTTRKSTRLKGSYPAEEALRALFGIDGPLPMCAEEIKVTEKRR
ncbi:MAG: penicillin-binding transpeptidase domain-containing protein [candidate division WOR-3 bacterium]